MASGNMSKTPNVTLYRMAPRSGAARCGSSSCSSSNRARAPMRLNRLRALAVVTILAAVFPVASLAQTPTLTPDPADRFFDDSVLHDISLAINSRDWDALKANFLDNTYYPC